MQAIANSQVSVYAELPEDLHKSIQKFLDTHPTIDFNTIVAKGIESFISKQSVEVKTNA